MSLYALAKGTSSGRYSQGGICCWTEAWSVSGSHLSHLINLFAKSQIDSDITPHLYGHGAPPKVRRGVMIDDCKIFVGKLGACLKSRWPMKMPSPMSRRGINFCCKDAFLGSKTSRCDCPTDYPSNAETKTICLKKLFLCSAVDWCFGAPLPTLIMSESIFWNDLTILCKPKKISRWN